MSNDRGKIYLIFWCPPDRSPEFETSYLEDYGKVFATEVRIPGFKYVGRGVSSTKEGSKNNASIHYLMHLIQDGLLDKKRVALRVPCLPLGVRPDGSFDPSPLPDVLEPVTDETFLQYNFPSERDREYDISPLVQSSQPRQHIGGRFQSLESRPESTVRDLNAALQKNQDSRMSGSVQERVPLQILVPQQAISHVIGADGNIIKRIAIKTGAKITFPEKIKDDLEGRVVTLIGEPDNVQAAAYIINKIIEWALVKAANSLKETLTFGENTAASQTDVTASGHPTQSSTSQKLMTDISTRNTESMQIVIPQKSAGYITGKESSVIKSLQRVCGVLINFINHSKDDPSGDRHCTLTGTSSQIQFASRKINAVIQYVEQNGSLPSIFLHNEGLLAVPNDTTVVIPVPLELVGYIIGRDGATIKRIQKQTGAVVKFSHNKKVDVGVKRCEISGAPDEVEAATKVIRWILEYRRTEDSTQENENSTSVAITQETSASKPETEVVSPTSQKNDTEQPLKDETEASPSQENEDSVTDPKDKLSEILIPEEIFVFVVGKDNGTIDYISKSTGVKISIPERKLYDDSGVRKCSVTGTPDQVETAAKRINALINIGMRNAQHSKSVQAVQAQDAQALPKPIKDSSKLERNAQHSKSVQAVQAQDAQAIPKPIKDSSKLEENKVQSTSQENQDIVPESIEDPPLELKSKKILPEPQKNWYRMAVRNSNHMNVIQSLKGYEFVLEPGLERAVGSVLASLNVNPMIIPENIQENFPFSLKLKPIVSTGKIYMSPQPDTVIRWWSPPQKNWDPWLNNNIDDPPLSEMSLEQIGTHLMAAHYSKIQNDETLQNFIKERKKAYIRSYQYEILHTVKTNSVTIIHGPSGTGKTTQVPQYILDSYLNLEHGAECCILVAQPRRVTAIATAERTAEERSETLGNSVGYEVLFETCFPRPYGCIMFCTLDVLLKRLEAGIQGVSHIILDEIHERNAKSDFIMAILRDMVKAFPHLRVVLMSATIDITPLSLYFSKCAVIEVPLEMHPVQEYYLEDIIRMLGFKPSQKENNEETEYYDQLDDKEDIKSNEYVNYGRKNRNFSSTTKLAMANINVKGVSFDLITALLTYIKSLNVAGAILIFLPDCNTIYTLLIQLQKHSVFGSSSYLCLPLHSEISQEDMESVFQQAPSGVTKIILSTSIAESAVTLKDVVYVIDSCKIVIRRFTSNNNAINYTITWAAKSNLEQRSRQASFIQPGCCYRLCSRECFSKLKNDIIPELHYTSLHEIILSIKQLRLGDSKQFFSKTLQPPTAKSILDAEEFLADLGALDKNSNLTPLGRMLARLPVEPRLGKMIILACLFSLGDTSCLLAVHNTIYPESSAPNLEKFLEYRCSDHIAFLNAFTQWENRQTEEKQAEKEFCEQNNLSSHILQLARDGKKQLKEIVQSMGFPESCLEQRNHCLTDHDANIDMIIALLVLGLHPNICFHKESRNASEFRTDLATSFNSPFFVFGKKICTEEATYKDMTMISVVHLLLFGNHSVELLHGRIQIDSWIDLRMDPETVSKIVAVRSALETLIGDIAASPKLLASLRTPSCELLNIVKALCNEIDDQYKAVPQYDTKSISSPQMEPPYKRRFLAADLWSSSDIQRKENQFDEYYPNPNIGHPLDNIPFGNVRIDASDYRSPVDSRNASADRYTSDNKYFERRAVAGGMDENGASRFGNEIFQRHSEAEGTEELGASRFRINRGDSTFSEIFSGTTAKSDLVYWLHGLARR